MTFPRTDPIYSPEVVEARQDGTPMVALESTVITHGLPYPENLQLAQDMEARVRTNGAVPATTAVLDGRLHIGLDAAQIKRLAKSKGARKLSRRDLSAAITAGAEGGTTVAATMFAAHRAGIKVFATGGIGGVHRQAPFDVSADLQALADTPVLVVSAGAKAILDLPATMEYLETHSVPVLGYQTDEFPAFYSRESGLAVSQRIETPDEAASLAHAHWSIGMPGGILVAVPVPEEEAVPADEMDVIINKAVAEAAKKGITGQEVTPFLLSRVSELSKGVSMRANLALLKNNAVVAAMIATSLSRLESSN